MRAGKRNRKKWMQQSSRKVLENVGVELEEGEQSCKKNRVDAVSQKTRERHGCGMGRWTRRLQNEKQTGVVKML